MIFQVKENSKQHISEWPHTLQSPTSILPSVLAPESLSFISLAGGLLIYKSVTSSEVTDY